MPKIYSMPKTLLISHFLQSCRQLVWTACRLHATSYAFASSYDVVYLHSLDKAGNALSVALTSAHELDIIHYAVLLVHVDDDELGAGAKSLECCLHV